MSYDIYGYPTPPRQPQLNLSHMLLSAIMGAAGMFFWLDSRTDSAPAPQPSPVVIDETPVPPPEDKVTDSYLVVVEETKGRPADRQVVLDDFEFWFGLKDRGMKGFRRYDPDSPDATQFENEAKERGVVAPFVMHVAGNGKVLSVIEFPSDVSQIERMLE